VQEDFKRLTLDSRARLSILAQFARTGVQFEQPEAKNGWLMGWFGHWLSLTHGMRRSF
jgi:hypothetical protein